MQLYWRCKAANQNRPNRLEHLNVYLVQRLELLTKEHPPLYQNNKKEETP